MKTSKILRSCASVIIGEPFIMFWNITNRCNLRCKFCSVWKTSSKELSTEEAKLAISNMDSIGITAVNIDGGEPLIRKDLEEIAKVCRDYGMVVTLNTNGTLITRQRAKRFIDVFSQVCVSIDGFEKTHDSIRGKGAFKKAMKGLELLLETNNRNGRKCIIGTNTVITKDNINEVIKLANHMKNLGTDFFGTCPINDPYPLDTKNPKIKRDMYPTNKDYEKLVYDLIRMKSKNNEFVIASGKFINLISKHFSSSVKICDIGRFSFFLDACGNVCACARFRKPLFNILDRGALNEYRNNKKSYDAELEKIKSICPGCLMGCTTDISIRCRFPNYIIEPIKSAPLILKGIKND